MHWLELKLPPVVTFALAVCTVWVVQRYIMVFSVGLPFPFVGFAVCFFFSGVFGVSGLWCFWHEKTTVDPVRPDRARQLVDYGIYRVSRNPMYVGLLWLLIGEVYWYGNLLGCFVIAGFVMYLTRYQIIPEERALRDKFGDTYICYCRRVRRWL